MRNRSYLASALLLLFMCASAARAAEPADVMIHGAGRTSGANATNPVWIVVYSDKDPKDPGTNVLFREKIGEDRWQGLEKLAFRVVEITSHANELVVVKDNRTSWAWFSNRFTYGPEIPDHQKILAIAGDRKSLWAIALPTVRSTQPSTTRPASTQPTSPVLQLFAGDTWTPQEAPWPAGIQFDKPEQVSMTMINENPTLAINTGDRYIHLLQYSRTARRWETMKDKVDNTPRPQWFKLLNFADQPAVWVWAEGDSGLGQIWTANHNLKLPEVGGIEVGDADVTVAGDQIWLVYRNKQEKLFQQRFNLDGSKADEQPKEVVWNKPQGANNHGDWITIGVMTMLTFLILSALLRRRAAANKDAGDENESDDNS